MAMLASWPAPLLVTDDSAGAEEGVDLGQAEGSPFKCSGGRGFPAQPAPSHFQPKNTHHPSGERPLWARAARGAAGCLAGPSQTLSMAWAAPCRDGALGGWGGFSFL